MNSAANRINTLAQINNAQKYLEIGVFKGATFNDISIPFRVGVDPHFDFDISPLESDPDTKMCENTSDFFFTNINEILEIHEPGSLAFDIIFIDGLHTCQQAFADFLNSIKHSTASTIWIFDDTVPCDPYASLPDKNLSIQYRTLAGLNRRPWMGDVYKCVFMLHDFYPFYSYATIVDDGNPQTVVWRTEKPATRPSRFNDINKIANMTYFDMLDNFELMNPLKSASLQDVIYKYFDIYRGKMKIANMIPKLML